MLCTVVRYGRLTPTRRCSLNWSSSFRDGRWTARPPGRPQLSRPQLRAIVDDGTLALGGAGHLGRRLVRRGLGHLVRRLGDRIAALARGGGRRAPAARGPRFLLGGLGLGFLLRGLLLRHDGEVRSVSGRGRSLLRRRLT